MAYTLVRSPAEDRDMAADRQADLRARRQMDTDLQTQYGYQPYRLEMIRHNRTVGKAQDYGGWTSRCSCHTRLEECWAFL